VKVKLPIKNVRGSYELRARMQFSTGEVQEVVFKLNVVSEGPAVVPAPRLVLFDPKV
jgi:hypothetical protein